MLTAERLRELLCYEPETGVFTWKVKRSGRNLEHRRAGYVDSHGYVKIMIGGHNFYAHRLAWMHVTGDWPADLIDHRDTNRSNNRWRNLRVANWTGNAGNSNRRKNNSSGFKGVHLLKRTGRFQAYITIDRVRKHLGYFDTAEDAHAVYAAAAGKHFGEFVRAA